MEDRLQKKTEISNSHGIEAQSLSSTRTPLASFRTPKYVTASKHDVLTSSVGLNSAENGKAIEKSLGKADEMGVLLVKPSLFGKQLTEDKSRPHQKLAEVTVLADKRKNQRNTTNLDRDFVASSVSTFQHSPLRENGENLCKFNHHEVAHTIGELTEQNPHKHSYTNKH